MFVLLNIETLPDYVQELKPDQQHRLTFKVVYTIKDVPDSFTGVVCENAAGELSLLHFNQPKGNKRKIITLKNKLVPGGFEPIKQALFALASGEAVEYPVEVALVQVQRRGRATVHTVQAKGSSE